MKQFNIVKHRKWFFLLSSLITVAGLIVFAVKGFNLGPDFKSGSRIQMQGSFSTAQVEHIFKDAGVNVSPSEIAYGGTTGNSVTIVRLPEVLTTQQASALTHQWTKTQIDTVDPFAAEVTSHKAVLAVLFASLFIMAYVAIRFEVRFAVSGIVALLHDAFIVMSVFALFRIEVNLLFVTAVLTIVGYSINDTIVIFDRIRENLKLQKPKTLAELEEVTDKSLWQTMRRSINTVTTVLIAAVSLYFFGGPTLHHFTLALIVGLISGAYSSIFIASPLWVAWRSRQLTSAVK
ncbi:protein translocase subunit SecF [Alicyclobacillus curvatus]|nr:protein translocase subunit SecF [Alicyclobacillus curvatus]